MRHAITLLVVAGSVSSSALAFQARSGGPAPGDACALLTRELVMKVSTAAGRRNAEIDKATQDYPEPRPGVSSCAYGRVVLVLNPLAKPEQIRNAMRARTFPYKEYEPVPGVGDAAFFEAEGPFANLYVFSGTRHFHIELGVGLDDTVQKIKAKDLKPNAITLAQAIIPKLR